MTAAIRFHRMDNELLDGFHLETLLVEPLTGQITGPDGSGHLTSRAVEVLLCLARQPRRLVSREEIINKVWGDGHGSNEALSHAISDLRHAFGDHADDPRFIQTVPRRGYRLLLIPRPRDVGQAALDSADSSAGPERKTSFWRSMIRHGVVQACVAYLVAGWLIIQVADATFDVLGMPRWALPFVTFVVIGGFPVVVLLSWFLEMAEGRMVVDRGEQPGGWLQGLERNYLAILAAYGLAVVGAGIYQGLVGFVEIGADPGLVADDADLIPVDDNSLAVLRFLNIDGSRTTQDFSEGLSEDILDRLASLPGLNVSSRGDAWSLPNNATSADVRRRLRVAYFLEGSVRLVGDDLRVVAQFIDSKTGYHVVSRSFNRKLQDFMSVQNEITELIVSNLRIALPEIGYGLPVLGVEDTSLTAYALYRRGKDALYQPSTRESIEAALKYFQDVLQIDPGYAAAYAGRCKAYINLYGIEHDIGNVADAEEACGAAMSTNARLPAVHDALGRLAVISGRYEDAETAYSEALKLNSQDAVALQGLAEVFQKQRRLVEAEEYYRKAISVQPGNWQSINMLGNFMFRNGRYAEASEQYRRVVYLNPDNYVVRSNLGSAQIMAGQIEAARETIEQALTLQADDTAYSNLGIIYYYLGDFEKSVATHRKAIAAAPKHYLGWINLGDALLFSGDRTGAQDAFAQSIELGEQRLAINPSDAEALYSLAWSLERLGQQTRADDFLKRARAIDPEDPYLYYYQALVEIDRKQFGAAKESLEQAIKLHYPKALLTSEPYLRDFLATGSYADQLGVALPDS